MARTLLFVVNVDWFFVSHRLALAEGALRQGYKVHLATTFTGPTAQIEALGITLHPIELARSGTGVASEWRSFWQIVRVLRSVRPDIVHLVTIKPVLFGGIAARWLRVPSVIAAVSGLGSVFVRRGARAALARYLLLRLYRLALHTPRVTAIFQNEDDMRVISEAAALPATQCALIRGSGVDLARFPAMPLPAGTPVAIMAARLLVDKGVREFVAAARELRARGLVARFCLVGTVDLESLAAISADEIEAWRSEGVVELLGHREDMPQVLTMAHLVVLPSYREGLPKVLVEAAACARAVVTTDVPGCRDAIEPGVSGLLVPARDSLALADAMARLLQDRALCERMGHANRALAERSFGLEQVVQQHLHLYARASRGNGP